MMIDKLLSAFSKLRGEVEALAERVDAIPAARDGKDGRDGVSPNVEDIAAAVLQQIPTPKDGVSPSAEHIAELVLQQIPVPKDGKDADHHAIVREVLAQMPKPRDGKDAPMPHLSDVAELIMARLPKPKDGRDGKDGVSPTAAEVAAAMPVPERGPAGKDGRDGKDGASVTDLKLDKNVLFAWIDGVKKRIGKIELPTQAPQSSAGAAGYKVALPIEGQVTHTEVLRGVSAVTQNPVGFNNPLTVSFGPAQKGPTDPVQLSAAGVLTINETALYDIRFSLQYGRDGAAGTSFIYLRTMISVDGGATYFQSGRSVLTKISSSTINLPAQNIATIRLEQGWKTKLEIIRGSEGSDSGGLIATIPAAPGWAPSYSAEAVIQKVEWERT